MALAMRRQDSMMQKRVNPMMLNSYKFIITSKFELIVNILLNGCPL